MLVLVSVLVLVMSLPLSLSFSLGFLKPPVPGAWAGTGVAAALPSGDVVSVGINVWTLAGVVMVLVWLVSSVVKTPPSFGAGVGVPSVRDGGTARVNKAVQV